MWIQPLKWTSWSFVNPLTPTDGSSSYIAHPSTPVFQERGPASRAWEHALTLRISCLRSHTYWQNKRFYWEGASRLRAAREGNPKLLHYVTHSLKFYDNGVSSWVVSGHSSFLAHIWSNSGSPLVVCTFSSQDGVQCEYFWEVGRIYYHFPSSVWLVLNFSG